MNEAEITRRLRALIATPRESRYIPIDRLGQLAGLGKGEVYEIARRGTMRESTRLRLAQALTWVENDQVMVKKRPQKPTLITIREPRPPTVVTTRIEMTKQGPRLLFVGQNPRTFPHYREES